jgi:hypothetical protein
MAATRTPKMKGHPGQGCPSIFHGLGNNSVTRYANTWPGDRSKKQRERAETVPSRQMLGWHAHYAHAWRSVGLAAEIVDAEPPSARELAPDGRSRGSLLHEGVNGRAAARSDSGARLAQCSPLRGSMFQVWVGSMGAP